MNYPYQGNPSQIDCHTDTDWAGDVATRLSTTAGTLMHGLIGFEGWSVTQKFHSLSSGESEFYSQGSGAARGLLMKHILSRSLGGEPKKTLMLHCDSVASRGVAQKVGSWEMPPHRGEVVVATAGHGREEASDEACSNRVKHCGHRYGGVDEQQKKGIAEPDG